MNNQTKLIIEYANHLELYEIGVRHPPQSFVYVDQYNYQLRKDNMKMCRSNLLDILEKRNRHKNITQSLIVDDMKAELKDKK